MALLKAFRIGEQKGFDNKDVQIQLTQEASHLFTPGGSETKTVAIADIDAATFQSLGGQDVVLAAFEQRVSAILSHDAFARATSDLGRLANDTVRTVSADLLENFKGDKVRTTTRSKPLEPNLENCGC